VWRSYCCSFSCGLKRRVRGPDADGSFASKSFVGLTAIHVAFFMVQWEGYSYSSLCIDQGGRLFATAAGAALLPLPLILTATSPMAGALAGRIGTRLPLTDPVPLVVAAGFLLGLPNGFEFELLDCGAADDCGHCALA